MEKGLMVSVYVDRAYPIGCTNGGVTSQFNRFILMAPGVEIFEASGRLPPLYLATYCGRLIACPVDLVELQGGISFLTEPGDTVHNLRGFMFGGNFVYSSDSRFPSNAPIPVFDRREG